MFNPNKVTTPSNNFAVDTKGYVQGMMIDNSPDINRIRSAFVDQSVVGNVQGGVPVQIYTDPSDPLDSNGVGQATLTGGTLRPATALAQYSGFSIYNGNFSGFVGLGNTAPVVGAGQNMNYVLKGSGVTLGVKCSDALAELLNAPATPINQQVSWDYTKNQLDIYDATGTTSQQILFTGITEVLDVSSNSAVISVAVDGTISWSYDGYVATVII
jgi:hypothetical protein